METQEINIVEILKDCPKWTMLYSPIFGNVKFECIENDSPFPIKVIDINLGINRALYFDKYGRFNIGSGIPSKECFLFPSEYQCNWSRFEPNQPVSYFIGDNGKVWFRKGEQTEEDVKRAEFGNEFSTREQAEYAAGKVKELLLSLRKEVK